MTIDFKGTEFRTAADAIQDMEDGEPGRAAIAIAGRYFVAATTECERLDAEGASFAYLNDVRGQLIMVPIH